MDQKYFGGGGQHLTIVRQMGEAGHGRGCFSRGLFPATAQRSNGAQSFSRKGAEEQRRKEYFKWQDLVKAGGLSGRTCFGIPFLSRSLRIKQEMPKQVRHDIPSLHGA
ncbi:hypothetical protein BUE76_09290 [Cnuella takakiae]|nr:hypothetical protein BUE76_09290 [Cnuella takakiae]